MTDRDRIYQWAEYMAKKHKSSLRTKEAQRNFIIGIMTAYDDLFKGIVDSVQATWEKIPVELPKAWSAFNQELSGVAPAVPNVEPSQMSFTLPEI